MINFPSPHDPFEIFLVSVPGFEETLAVEARVKGLARAKAVKGGVTLMGHWPDVWRANLVLRGASRVLARIDSFRVTELYDLDRRARLTPWHNYLDRDIPVRVETTCAKSKIYHSDAATERIERAIWEEFGAPIVGHFDGDYDLDEDNAITIKARFDNDVCTIAIDTSGVPLHKRGHKQAVNVAPLRETLASLFLRELGYDGKVPLVDPMCGSGTFLIEAAEIAAHLNPGRGRSFAFERLKTFDDAGWQRLRGAAKSKTPLVRFYGSDRDAGAVTMSLANADRAGVATWCDFHHHAVSDLVPPPGPAGLVVANPPYGGRIGEMRELAALYRAFGQTLRTKFSGWRVGIVTNDATLAQATGLPFGPPFGPISHGGLRVYLYATAPLP